MSLKKEDHILSTQNDVFLEQRIALKVAEILRREYAGETSPIKRISQKTGIAPNTIKNWYNGQNYPRLAHFLILAQNHSAILRVLLEAIGGSDLWDAFTLLGDKLKSDVEPPKLLSLENIYSTENCTINISLPTRIARRLNARQLWFLSQLQKHQRVKADDIVVQWGTSIVSAKTDIAEMTRLKLIRFVGARKTGWYKIMPATRQK